MTHTHPTPHLERMDRLGQSLAGLLSQASPELPHDLSERLRIARQQALAMRLPEPTPSWHVLQQGSSLTLAGPPSEGLGLWSVLGSAIPVLTLLTGLLMVQWWDHDRLISELAEIDTALLVDDLPPTAYSDPGFIQFLRHNTPVPHEE
ncbi:MAG: DUF3619 family protein [Betaproteobacteria bacterium]|nr:DUF3619 family protein [Betaproteobacteria bacterium]